MTDNPTHAHLSVEAVWPDGDPANPRLWSRFDIDEIVEAETSRRRALDNGAVSAKVYQITRGEVRNPPDA